MDGGFEKNQTISDYAVFLKKLLPEIVGFRCIDRAGNLFWEKFDEPVEFSELYTACLQQILRSPQRAGDAGRVPLDNATAYIFPLLEGQDLVLGALTILVSPELDLDFATCLERTKVGVRSLQRELRLGYRLMASYKKLNVRSAEENLLHQVEKLVHSRRTCDDTLSHILLLCRKFLGVGGAALLIPDKHIRLFEGEVLSPVEARLLLSDMVDQVGLDSQYQRILQDDAQVSENTDVLSLPIHQDKKEPIGVLVLSGWGKSDFSVRRRRRIARYLVAHIEDVIARDYDALTGLMSWPLFEAQLIKNCKNADGENHFVLSFNVDQLHVINDNFGHETGDEILAAFAQLITERLGTHLSSRITSDSFAALLTGVDMARAKEYAEEICQSFGELEYKRGDQTLRPTVSIGIGPVTSAPRSASEAMAAAQVACRAAKDRGRSRVEMYESGDASIVQRMDDIQSVGHIRSAIEKGRVILFGQPIVAMRDDRHMHYFEVLVRLLNASGGQLMPADFFSAAERYNLMEDLDRWVVSETLKTLAARMHVLKDLPLRIAINLSGQSLGSKRFLPFVEEKIKQSGVPPQVLCFEITETVAVANLQSAQAFMHSLKKLGCHFSLDDFGTGLSSFAYLKLFPVDTMKIDGSFVQDISTNVVSQSVVAAMSEVARVMNLDTVAEYVQNEEAMSLLRDLGVTWGQGFFLGEPELLTDQLDGLVASVSSQSRSA
jgi:diguanylate cyclase (GGDEF)-like protein